MFGRLISLRAVLAGALMFVTSAASAGVVLSPTSTFNNTMGQFSVGLAPINMINQGGLLSPFISGVTDLNTYIGSNPLHATLLGSGNAFATPSNVTTGSIDLDLGADFNIGTFILWHDNTTGSGSAAPKDFSLTGSLLADFSVSTLLGNFSSTPPAGGNIPAQTFAFASTTIRYVRWTIQNVHGDPAFPNINVGEIAFGTAIPEPGTLALFGLGLIGLGFARRRKAA